MHNRCEATERSFFVTFLSCFPFIFADPDEEINCKKKPRSWGLQQEAATPLYLYESKQMGPARKRYNPAPPSLSNLLLLLLVGILVIHTQEHGQKTQRAA